MWKCKVCGVAVDDDTWTECWKCGSQRDADSASVEKERNELNTRLERAKKMECVRCGSTLRFLGTKRFHEGTRQWGFWLGDLGELFVNREAFDIFACPICGKIEFFVDGLGEEFRPNEERQD